MAWLVGIVVAGLAWNSLADEQRLRTIRRLLSSHGPATPELDSPSPHQLLGDIARPLKHDRAPSNR
jgi:hypothetical protein